MRILGIDPGLNYTGWALIENKVSSLRYIKSGVITTKSSEALEQRLFYIYSCLRNIIETTPPDVISLEETFVNKDPRGALKLGYARGIALMVPGIYSLPVFEYAPNTVKKVVCGNGHASKEQIQAMIKFIMPSVEIVKKDESDALAIALCHAYHKNY